MNPVTVIMLGIGLLFAFYALTGNSPFKVLHVLLPAPKKDGSK